MGDSKRVFNGIPIEGHYFNGRTDHVEQEPIENLYPYFKDAFSKGVKAITWAQYTPYYNDGEVCEFGVGEVAFTSDPKIAAKWIECAPDWYFEVELPNGSYKEYNIADYFNSYSTHPDGFAPGSIGIPVEDTRFEMALLTTFGDHTQVVVTPERVIQFSYDHDE